MQDAIHLRAVAYRDGERWLVQGIEHDILARAQSADDAPVAFMKAVFENFCINHHLGRSGLDGIDQAPARFKLLFSEAERVDDANETALAALHLHCPPELSLSDMPTLELRVAEQTAA